MSVKLIARVWAHSQRKDGELLVMLALADFANDAGESWPSIPVLAQKARLTDRQARRVLAKLEQAGEIRCVKSNGGRNRRNHYFICLSENPDNITLTKLQGKNTSVKKYTGIGDTKTLTPMSGALNRHRTVNKNKGAKAPDSFSPIIEKTIRRMNELSGKNFKTTAETITENLRACLKAGASESDCLAVVEDRWRLWGGTDMARHYNPITLFRKSKFELYLTEAEAHEKANGKPPTVKELSNGMVEVDGRQMDRRNL